MCKVLMIPGIKKKHHDKVKLILDKMAESFSRLDDDGFGYAAVTSKGKIYGEKWLKKEDVFKLHHKPTPDEGYKKTIALLGAAAGKTEDVVSSDENVYDSFGLRSSESLDDTVAVIFHARKKTQGEKVIQNAHPFYIVGEDHTPDTALIHNGSILNHRELTKKFSTCDSEVILHEYMDKTMYYNPYGIEDIAKKLVGEYTVGVLSSIEYEDKTVQPILDIFKSKKDLYVCYVKEIETNIFCTTDWAIKQVMKELGFSFVCLTEVKDGFFMRIDATTGERIDDLIPFDLSKTTLYTPAVVVGPAANKLAESGTSNVRNLRSDTVEEAKRKFEANHGDLFSDKYYDLTDGLNPAERAFYEELEKDKNTDMKALRLVKKIMNL